MNERERNEIETHPRRLAEKLLVSQLATEVHSFSRKLKKVGPTGRAQCEPFGDSSATPLVAKQKTIVFCKSLLEHKTSAGIGVE